MVVLASGPLLHLVQPKDDSSSSPLHAATANAPKAMVPAGADDSLLLATDDTIITRWQAQYPMPEEASPACLPAKKHLYRPPASDLPGIAIACTVIGLWAVLLHHALFRVRLPGQPPCTCMHACA